MERRRHRLLARADPEQAAESFDRASDERLTAQRLAPRIASALARLSPAERDLLLLIAWAARAWARLQREFDAGAARRRSPRVRIGRRAAITGAVAGAAVIIAAVLVSPQPGGAPYTTPQSSPHAAGPSRSTVNTTLGTLELAAATVERTTVPPRPGPGQWVYTRTVTDFALQPSETGGPAAEVRGKVKVEEWWKFDGKAKAEGSQAGPGIDDFSPQGASVHVDGFIQERSSAEKRAR
jgi:hypothetical protein